jgi:Spy/CpxP family protein refolding chaperone
MRNLFTSALVLSLAIPVVAEDNAKGKSQQKMHAQTEVIELMLLRQKSVREELKLPADATKKIFDFTYKQQQAAAETHKLPKEEQKTKRESMTKENEDFLHTALTPEQHKRLKQIAIQTAGLLFVTQPKLAQELNLTPEQKEQAKKLAEETDGKTYEVMQAKSKEGRYEKLAELRKASDKKLAQILTAEQRQKMKELAGEPFQGKFIFEEVEPKK